MGWVLIVLLLVLRLYRLCNACLVLLLPFDMVLCGACCLLWWWLGFGWCVVVVFGWFCCGFWFLFAVLLFTMGEWFGV